MSIQRWKAYPHDPKLPAMVGTATGEFVLYTDHVAAVAEVAGLSDEAIYNDGVLAERARHADDPDWLPYKVGDDTHYVHTSMVRMAEQAGHYAERARYSQPSMYDEGRWAERARIKAAVEALYMHAYPGEYGQLDAVLAIIDGEQA